MADSSPTPSTIARLVDAGALPPGRRHVRTVFGGGIALAVGGAVLVAGMWLSVVALVRAERAEAIDSEMGKNANLALALEVQTNQRIRSIDQFLLLMRHQYEQAPPRVPFRELVAPAIADAKGIALIAAIDERGDVVETLTERRQLEQQVYRAQRLESLGTLAGGLAHDLNNVLTPIILANEILREGATDDTRDLLKQIGDSAQRGAEMVGQVLSFARGKEGRRGEAQVKPLVDDVARIARDTLPKNITIATDVAPSLPAVIGDATQFHQVLLNLCVNARDAMPGGGRLTFAASTLALPAVGEPLPGDMPAGRGH